MRFGESVRSSKIRNKASEGGRCRIKFENQIRGQIQTGSKHEIGLNPVCGRWGDVSVSLRVYRATWVVLLVLLPFFPSFSASWRYPLSFLIGGGEKALDGRRYRSRRWAACKFLACFLLLLSHHVDAAALLIKYVMRAWLFGIYVWIRPVDARMCVLVINLGPLYWTKIDLSRDGSFLGSPFLSRRTSRRVGLRDISSSGGWS
jgi:hypothetical protein